MKTYFFTLSLFISLCWISCNKDKLNDPPVDKYTDNVIWKDSLLVEHVLATAYSGMYSIYDEYTDVGNHSLPCDITDEAKASSPALFSNKINVGQYSAYDGAYYTAWTNTYANVRICNSILNRLPTLPFSKQEKQKLQGEALFLRAFHYMTLYYTFGRFPIIRKELPIGDKLLNEPRASDDACIAFMSQDLDSAALLLPASTAGASLGRATKYAALGMKCRLLLNKKDYNNAMILAKEIIDQGGYSLFPDYEAQFYPENDDNKEVIFSKEFGSQQSGQTHQIDAYDNSSFFSGASGGGSTDCPTQNIVDQYLMIDGKPWDKSDLYDATKPYANRDPRFAASIIYDGCTWMNTKMDMAIGSATNPRQGGGGGTPTGYMLRKFLNPSYSFAGDNPNYQNCIILRLAEIYLNYAECALKLGNAEEARTYINLLRKRVNMPEVQAGQMTWDIYVRERTVELAFEGQRWNDIRRWETGPQMIGAAINAVQIETINGTRSYTTVPLEQRYFDPKMYYFPIPLVILNDYPAGKALEQNPGW